MLDGSQCEKCEPPALVIGSIPLQNEHEIEVAEQSATAKNSHGDPAGSEDGLRPPNASDCVGWRCFLDEDDLTAIRAVSGEHLGFAAALWPPTTAPKKTVTEEKETYDTFKAKVLAKLSGIKDGRLRRQKLEQTLVLLQEDKHWQHDERPGDRSEDILKFMDYVVEDHTRNDEADEDEEDEDSDYENEGDSV